MKALLLWWVIVNGVPVLGGVEPMADMQTCVTAAPIWRELLPADQEDAFRWTCTPARVREP